MTVAGEADGTVPSGHAAAGLPPEASLPFDTNLGVENIRRTTEGLIEQLHIAARETGVVPGEPMMPLVDAFARTLAWQGELAAQAAHLAHQIPATLGDVRIAAEAEIARERAAMATTGAEFAKQLAGDVAEAVKRGDAERTAVFRRNSLLATAGAAALTLVLVGGGSYLVGRADGRQHVQQVADSIAAMLRRNPTSADAWTALMAANDPQQFLGACHGVALKVIDGRRACSAPIWLDPPKMDPPLRR